MGRWYNDRSAHRGIPSVSLRRILPDARWEEFEDLLVTGCTSDFRRLEPGQLFVALTDERRDGHLFVNQALERGAVGVLVERDCPEAGRLQVRVADTKAAHARLCHALHGNPSERLEVFGVTGMGGKTATATFLRAILQAAGHRVGLLSSAGWSDGVSRYPARPSAPHIGEIAEMLNLMVDRRCRSAVLAIDPVDLGRHIADSLKLTGVLCTGIGGRTLDADSRREARRGHARLVRAVRAGGMISLNADDEESAILAASNLDAGATSFGTREFADVSSVRLGSSPEGTRVRLRGLGLDTEVLIRPIGSRATIAALGAACLARSSGIDPDSVATGLQSVRSIPDRLEPAGDYTDLPPNVWRVSPRNQEGLVASIADLREAGFRRVTCLIAEPVGSIYLDELTRVAEERADQLIVMLDGSARENPIEACDRVRSSLRRPGRVRFVSGAEASLGELILHGDRDECTLLVARSYRPIWPAVQVCLPMVSRTKRVVRRTA